MTPAILITLLIVSLAACSGDKQNDPANTEIASAPAQQSQNNPEARDRMSIMKELYTANCALCHKDDGTGGKMTKDGKTLDVEDLTAEKIKKMSDEKIQSYIVDGVPSKGMPAFKDKLSERDITMLVRYVRVLQNPAASPGNSSDPTGSR
jgi:mono/diheme cytochrome c family protein